MAGWAHITLLRIRPPTALARLWPRPSRWLFCAGVFPTDADQYPESARKHSTSQSFPGCALKFEPGNQQRQGFGFRCGFLWAAAHENRAGAAGAGIHLDLIVTRHPVIYQVTLIRRHA